MTCWFRLYLYGKFHFTYSPQGPRQFSCFLQGHIFTIYAVFSAELHTEMYESVLFRRHRSAILRAITMFYYLHKRRNTPSWKKKLWKRSTPFVVGTAAAVTQNTTYSDNNPDKTTAGPAPTRKNAWCMNANATKNTYQPEDSVQKICAVPNSGERDNRTKRRTFLQQV